MIISFKVSNLIIIITHTPYFAQCDNHSERRHRHTQMWFCGFSVVDVVVVVLLTVARCWRAQRLIGVQLDLSVVGSVRVECVCGWGFVCGKYAIWLIKVMSLVLRWRWWWRHEDVSRFVTSPTRYFTVLLTQVDCPVIFQQSPENQRSVVSSLQVWW